MNESEPFDDASLERKAVKTGVVWIPREKSGGDLLTVQAAVGV